MDPYDESILRALKDGGTREFHQLLEDVGFSHNTLRLHLNNIMQRPDYGGEDTDEGAWTPKIHIFRVSRACAREYFFNVY